MKFLPLTGISFGRYNMSQDDISTETYSEDIDYYSPESVHQSILSHQMQFLRRSSRTQAKAISLHIVLKNC